MLSLREDTKFARLAILLESDIARMASTQAGRVAGHDDARMDSEQQVVTYFRGGALLWEARYEAVGTLDPEFQIWRWWWANKVGHTGSPRLDVAYGQVQQQQIPVLVEKAIRVESEKDASWLAHVMARLARADGVLRIRENDKATFVALFDAGRADRPSQLSPVVRPSERALGKTSERVALPNTSPERMSMAGSPGDRSSLTGTVPQMPASASTIGTPIPPRARPPTPAVNSLPGKTSVMDPEAAPPDAGRVSQYADEGRASFATQSLDYNPQRGAHEPPREIFLPVAQLAIRTTESSLQDGFRQALFVVYVDTGAAKARFSTTLVAVDTAGLLQVVDTGKELLEATARMISEDARLGNGRWHRLTARFTITSRGTTIDVSVAM